MAGTQRVDPQQFVEMTCHESATVRPSCADGSVNVVAGVPNLSAWTAKKVRNRGTDHTTHVTTISHKCKASCCVTYSIYAEEVQGLPMSLFCHGDIDSSVLVNKIPELRSTLYSGPRRRPHLPQQAGGRACEELHFAAHRSPGQKAKAATSLKRHTATPPQCSSRWSRAGLRNRRARSRAARSAERTNSWRFCVVRRLSPMQR